MKKSIEVKEKIIEATISLMQESNGNATSITTRDIAKRAFVGNGLINYHFQTKENLIEISVARMISNVIKEFKPSIDGCKTHPNRLTASATQVFEFLIKNPAISRISILGDLSNYIEGNNSDNTQKGFMSILGDELSNNNNRFFSFSLVSTMQVAFLSQSISKELLGYDFNNSEDIANFIEKLVSMLYDGIRKEEISERSETI